MSIAASAENTMKFLETPVNNNSDNDNPKSDNTHFENKDEIFFKSHLSDSDDDMVVIILKEEDVNVQHGEECDNNNNREISNSNKSEGEGEGEGESETGKCATNKEQCTNCENSGKNECEEKCAPITALPKKKYIGIEVYTHFQDMMESKKMYPLLPCNMISSFAHAMEYVEYFDIPSEERKKLVVDLVKILAYSNNDHGSRTCFEYFMEHNMVDDIMQTIIDSTKNRYDINRFPHTNRKFVLSCVSLSNKIKIVKPSAKIESLFEEFKLNLCGLKRFFKMREKDESKQT